MLIFTVSVLACPFYLSIKAQEFDFHSSGSNPGHSPLAFPEDNGLTDFLDDDYIGDFLEAAPTAHARQIPPIVIIELLKEFGIIELLQEDIFLKTNRINKQNILDMPIMGNQLILSTRNRVTGFDLFWNPMYHGYFTKHSPCISSYINLTGESLIDAIENTLERVKELFNNPLLNIDVEKILGLFKNMSLHQRRLGFLFYHVHRHNKIITRFKIPLYYLERNFFLTPEERACIAQEFGEATPEEEDELRKHHFESDKLGFGDCRLEIEGPVYESEEFTLNLGGYITLPTAFALKKGLHGSSFPTPSTLPDFTIFEDLFALAENPDEQAQEKAFNEVKDFLFDAFDRLSSNLLDVGLGNEGHVGLALFYHTHMPVSVFIKRPGATQVHLVSKTSLEYLFPAIEKRFFISKNDAAAFAARNFDDPAQAESNLQFLEQEFINRLFLVAYNTRVQPGIIFHSNNKFCYQGMRWGWNIGTDTWVQSRDKLSTIKVPPCPNTVPLENLDIEKAKPFFAYRWRLCGGVNYQIQHPDHDWNISLNADTTMAHSGIGADYSVFFKFERHY